MSEENGKNLLMHDKQKKTALLVSKGQAFLQCVYLHEIYLALTSVGISECDFCDLFCEWSKPKKVLGFCCPTKVFKSQNPLRTHSSATDFWISVMLIYNWDVHFIQPNNLIYL